MLLTTISPAFDHYFHMLNTVHVEHRFSNNIDHIDKIMHASQLVER